MNGVEPIFGVVAQPKLWEGVQEPEKIEVNQIATHAHVQIPEPKVNLFYLYTNFEWGVVECRGKKNVIALALREMKDKMITEENIEKLCAEGRIIRITEKDATWSITKTTLAKFKELHCSQIAIVRQFPIKEKGAIVMKYKALCTDLDHLHYTSANTDWEANKNILLEMVRANLRAEQQMHQQPAFKLREFPPSSALNSKDSPKNSKEFR